MDTLRSNKFLKQQVKPQCSGFVMAPLTAFNVLKCMVNDHGASQESPARHAPKTVWRDQRFSHRV